MNRFFCGSLFLILMCGISSCSLLRPSKGKKAISTIGTDSTQKARGTTRWANLPAPDTINAPTDNSGAMQELIKMITPVWNTRLAYRTLTGKAKVHFEGPSENQDFTANIRLKKDTAIWVDITALGGMIHAARVLITPDSFFMLNYLQKEYSKVALRDVAKILPTTVDFNSLQNIVTGEPLRNGTITDVSELANSWMVHVSDSSYVQTVNCTKADSSIIMDQVNTKDPNGPQALLKFERFELTCGKKIAMSRTINIQNLQDRFLVEMDFTSIDFDKEFEMPFSIPGKFTLK